MFAISSHKMCNSEYFRGSPFYARALDLEAKKCDLEAKRCDLPQMDFDGPVMVDPAKGEREKLDNKLQGIRADFHRLSADMNRWKAKQYRKADSTQKSLRSPFDAVLKNLKKMDMAGAELIGMSVDLDDATDDLEMALKNPKGTGVDIDTGMMPQRDVDVAPMVSPAPAATNPDQPYVAEKKGKYATRKKDKSVNNLF